MADPLHIFDLGISHYVCGNVLFELCYTAKYFPAVLTPTGRLELLWGLVVAAYRRSNSTEQLGQLTLSMFTDPNAPRATQPILSSRVKAAETRHLVPILLGVFRDLHDAACESDVRILHVLSNLSDSYGLLEREEYMFGADVVQRLDGCVQGVLVNYRYLNYAAITAGLQRWHEVPKFHYAEHSSLQSAYGNPRYNWTYMEEDFMGHLKSICARCTEGAPATAVVPKLLAKWAYGILLNLDIV